MTIHYDWDKTGSACLAAPKMAWFVVDGHAPISKPSPRRKRLFDVALALILPLSMVMAVVAVLMLVQQGRPIFYSAERMRAPGQPFWRLKFRTMIPERTRISERPARTSIGASRRWAIPAAHVH